MKHLPLLLLLPLAACAVADPVPQSARLGADTLTVVMSDGTTCRAPVSVARLERCGRGFDVAVTPEGRPNILRQLAEAAFGVLGADGFLAPLATVTLTDAAGRDFTFVSPPPLPKDQN